MTQESYSTWHAYLISQVQSLKPWVERKKCLWKAVFLPPHIHCDTHHTHNIKIPWKMLSMNILVTVLHKTRNNLYPLLNTWVKTIIVTRTLDFHHYQKLTNSYITVWLYLRSMLSVRCHRCHLRQNLDIADECIMAETRLWWFTSGWRLTEEEHGDICEWWRPSTSWWWWYLLKVSICWMGTDRLVSQHRDLHVYRVTSHVLGHLFPKPVTWSYVMWPTGKLKPFSVLFHLQDPHRRGVH